MSISASRISCSLESRSASSARTSSEAIADARRADSSGWLITYSATASTTRTRRYWSIALHQFPLARIGDGGVERLLRRPAGLRDHDPPRAAARWPLGGPDGD